MIGAAKQFGCAFVLGLFLAACGGPTQHVEENTDGVQDIQPGQQSVIQPPSSTPAPDQSSIHEKDI